MPNIATTGAVRLVSTHGASPQPAFDPNSVTGLVAWFDASDTSSLTVSGSPSKASQWNNKTTSSTLHATQATSANQPFSGTRTINSLNTLEWTTGAVLMLSVPNTIMGSATAATAVYVYASDSDPVTGVNGGAPLFEWGTVGTTDLEPYSDGNVYQGWGSNARKTVGNPTASLTTPHVFSIVSTATEWTYRIDGATVYTTATNTVAWSANPRIGGDATTWTIDGRIAEIIVFATANATSRTDSESYLRTKWGTP